MDELRIHPEQPLLESLRAVPAEVEPGPSFPERKGVAVAFPIREVTPETCAFHGLGETEYGEEKPVARKVREPLSGGCAEVA